MGKSCIRFKSLDDLALNVLGDAIAAMPAKVYIEHYKATLAKGKPKTKPAAKATPKPQPKPKPKLSPKPTSKKASKPPVKSSAKPSPKRK
jgi:outer membrane biosynthesis protein TonB